MLARDRMGIKPLYIARRGEDLFFGSELKAILVHPEIDRRAEPGRPGLLSVAELRAVPLDAGRRHRKAASRALAGMARRPGHAPRALLAVAVRLCRATGLSNRRRRNSIHCCEQSVREHLLSDVPLGVWLSGGIDSSTILHYAAQASTSQLKTFSISFQGAASTRRSTSSRLRRSTEPSTSNST